METPGTSMKRRTVWMIPLAAVIALAALLSPGCGPKKAGNTTEAIERAKLLKSSQEQEQYLVSQAQSFLGSKDYQEASKTAQYVLSSIDTKSAGAKQVLEEAKRQLASDAQAAIGDAKKNLGL